VKVELLPSSFASGGVPSPRQHLACLIVNDRVAIDAGSLAFAVSDAQRNSIRDIVLTHAHLDHIAGLPLFIDDLFATLESPIRIYAADDVINILERDIFNWDVYPKFSELNNENGPVIEYITFKEGEGFNVDSLTFQPVAVNHKVPSFGFIVRDGQSAFAITGDTTSMEGFWEFVNNDPSVRSVLIECAFPDELGHIAERSYHMTPSLLRCELKKLRREDCEIHVINIKPMYREQVVRELNKLGLKKLRILEAGQPNYF
jgi:cAMP phosphodiesterase